jgi:serine/threonine-protein kinase ULK/ATG1
MEQNKGFTIGNYVSDGKRIGKGAFATVFLGHRKDNPSELVAIKVVDVERLTRSNQKLKRQLDSEISIMKTLHHEHIVTLHEVFVGTEYIYLVLEYCVGGDFSDYLKKRKRLSEDTVRYFLRQLASGLKYLHSKNIVHRDLKPQNLLMAAKRGRGGDGGGGDDDEDESTKWELKIADFGFARFIEPQSVASTLCGSPLYMAPEVLLCQPYDAKADLWSVGAIVYEMLTGSPPFNVRTHIELVHILLSEQVKFPRNMGVSSECMDLLQSLLKKNKEERITWREFFSHPFIVHDTSGALTTFKASTSQAIPISHSGSRRKRSVTMGSAPTNSSTEMLLLPSPPAFGSPSSPGSFMHIPTSGCGGSSGDLNSPTYLRSPASTSSGGFSMESFGSGWGSGPRRPLTNPFKESFDFSPLPSATAESESKEKEGADSSDTDDSFELLDSTPDSSVSTSTAPEERHVIDALALMVRKASVVTELADTKIDMSPLDALALYIKALHIYHSVSQWAKKAAQSHHLASSSRLGLVVERMRSEFTMTLKKAEYLKRNLKPNDSCPPAEKSIYESALQMGREGAVAEVLRYFNKAESLYVRSSQLLQLLTMDAHHPSDKAVLESYIASFEKRLGEVRKKQTALDDTVNDSLTVTSE